MTVMDKEQKLKRMLDVMTADEIKAMTAEAFIDGLEKGMKIQCMTNEEAEKQATA